MSVAEVLILFSITQHKGRNDQPLVFAAFRACEELDKVVLKALLNMIDGNI